MTELRNLLLKQKTLKWEKRIKCLLAIKFRKFGTRGELADYLGVHIRTQERWLNNYKAGGAVQMLLDRPKNKQSKIITSVIHKGLEQKVNYPHSPFLGYWDTGVLRIG